jgi:flagellar biosynthesis/type III secretory pathway M-ring protein FliF/YscJ
MKKITNKALLVIAALFIIATIIVAAVFTHQFNTGTLFQPDSEQVTPAQLTKDDNIFLDETVPVFKESDTVITQL